jgi:hypothetical protein
MVVSSAPPLRWFLLLICCAFVGASPVQAQTESVVRVVVTSADDGSPLPGANVVLTALGGTGRHAGATDVDGFLEIRGIERGRYQIAVSFVGYVTHRDTLALRTERRVYNVSLRVQEQELQEVEIEAEGGAARQEAGLQTATAADLNRIPTPGPSGDLASYLQTLPGVVSVGDRGGRLFIRGGTPSQNLIQVDGIPITNPFHISSLYSAFPQEIIRSADIYAGGFTAEYMDATSSVIDVTLRQGNMKEFAGSASISPFLASTRVEGPLERGRQSVLVVARRSIIDETSESLYDREVPLTFYDITGRYTLQTESATCHVTGMFTDDEGRINNDRNTVLAWSNTALGGRCLVFGERIDRALDFRAGYSRFDNDAGTAAAPERSASTDEIYMSIDTEQPMLGTTLDFGARFSVTTYEADLDEKFVSLDRIKENGASFEVYGSLTFTPSNNLTIKPSLGTHLTGQRLGTPTLEPRVRMTYRPLGSDRQEISLALGKYNQVDEGLTDRRDAGTNFTVWRLADEDNAYPQALHGILGYSQQIGDAVEVSVEGYAKRLSNVLVPQWTPEARFNTRTALADGSVYGVDARLEFQTGSFYSFVGYGWSTVEYEAARDDLGAWIEGNIFSYSPPHDRRHQVNAVASYELAGVTANVSWQFGSGRPYTKVFGFDLAPDLPAQKPTTSPGTAFTLFDRPYGARLPTYHRLDVSLGRSFDLTSGLSIETKAGAINTYDRSNIFYFDVNTLQRVDQSPVLPYLSLRVQVD